ncbi:pyridoxal-phosphate dependent enzyme, partial [Mesorhizobium sp. M7A.F.Ca.CA.001.16.1.1]
ADSLAPKRVGEMMFPIAEAYVERSILVGDDDIVAAQKALWNRTRIISEPGGAAAFAAILSGRYAPAQGERLAVLVCGANADPATF